MATYIPDHSVAVTTMIGIHDAIKAVQKLVVELPPERLCEYYAMQLEAAAKEIRWRIAPPAWSDPCKCCGATGMHTADCPLQVNPRD